MSEILDKIGRILIPPALRPYLTFRSVTVLIIALYALAFILKKLVHVPASSIAAVQAEERIFYSRGFLLVYNAALSAGIVAVYLTRHRPAIYFRRVVIYGILLAAILGELMDLLVPWRV